VEICEIREETGERVRFFHVDVRRSIIQQGGRKIEVGKRNGCESFHQDVYDNIGIVQIAIELVSEKKENQYELR